MWLSGKQGRQEGEIDIEAHVLKCCWLEDTAIDASSVAKKVSVALLN